MMRRMGWDTKWLRVKDKMCGYVDESNENRTQENGGCRMEGQGTYREKVHRIKVHGGRYKAKNEKKIRRADRHPPNSPSSRYAQTTSQHPSPPPCPRAPCGVCRKRRGRAEEPREEPRVRGVRGLREGWYCIGWKREGQQAI
jgi:hypothetical protein